MASKAKLSGSINRGRSAYEVKEGRRLPVAAREQEIRLRAYAIYLERGASPGRELEDWLQAERELTTIQKNLPLSSAARAIERGPNKTQAALGAERR